MDRWTSPLATSETSLTKRGMFIWGHFARTIELWR